MAGGIAPQLPDIAVAALPPERHHRGVAPAQAGGCCCCCCCCLHTLGGVVGAAVAPALGGPAPLPPRWADDGDWDDDGDDGFDRPQARPSRRRDYAPPAAGMTAVAYFWLSLLGVTALAAAGAAVEYGVLGSAAVVVLGLPLLQLGAAGVTALILAFSDRPDRGHQFRRLGLIVLGVVVGAGGGMAAMYLAYLVLS